VTTEVRAAREEWGAAPSGGFIGADQKVHLAALESLSVEDVVSYSDGGEIVRAARVRVSGRERLAGSLPLSLYISGRA
jgi:hypothetical protein